VSLSSQTFTAIVIQTSLITATEMLTLPLISDQIIPLLPNRPSLFGFQELDQNQPRRTFRQTSEISSIFFFFLKVVVSCHLSDRPTPIFPHRPSLMGFPIPSTRPTRFQLLTAHMPEPRKFRQASVFSSNWLTIMVSFFL
jgi:hypothetical protein